MLPGDWQIPRGFSDLLILSLSDFMPGIQIPDGKLMPAENQAIPVEIAFLSTGWVLCPAEIKFENSAYLLDYQNRFGDTSSEVWYMKKISLLLTLDFL